jgi:hypothetical protein
MKINYLGARERALDLARQDVSHLPNHTAKQVIERAVVYERWLTFGRKSSSRGALGRQSPKPQNTDKKVQPPLVRLAAKKPRGTARD